MIKNYKKEFVFDFDTAPTPSCHASTVLPLDDGTVLAAWFGGTAEGKDDVVIWVSRRTENGWEKPIQVSDSDNI
ncbi:MAG TPA: exo-alpha-sialidase, partial [Clostridiales bacterium]|nr:exo-alpha-sialidase [Clostridiales bacterium]